MASSNNKWHQREAKRAKFLREVRKARRVFDENVQLALEFAYRNERKFAAEGWHEYANAWKGHIRHIMNLRHSLSPEDLRSFDPATLTPPKSEKHPKTGRRSLERPYRRPARYQGIGRVSTGRQMSQTIQFRTLHYRTGPEPCKGRFDSDGSFWELGFPSVFVDPNDNSAWEGVWHNGVFRLGVHEPMNESNIHRFRPRSDMGFFTSDGVYNSNKTGVYDDDDVFWQYGLPQELKDSDGKTWHGIFDGGFFYVGRHHSKSGSKLRLFVESDKKEFFTPNGDYVWTNHAGIEWLKYKDARGNVKIRRYDPSASTDS